jgi:hypothetical protein
MSFRSSAKVASGLFLFALSGCAVGTEDGSDDVAAQDELVEQADLALEVNPSPSPAFALEISGCPATATELARFQAPVITATLQALRAVDLGKNGNGNILKIHDYRVAGNPFVTQVCRSGKMIIGGWLERAGAQGASDTVASRQAILGAMSVMQGTETLGFRVTASAVNSLVGFAFADVPKNMNEQGLPSSSGPLFLYSAGASFPSSSTLQLKVSGMFDGPTSETDFDVLMRDKVSITADKWLSCTSDLDVDLEVTFDSVMNTIFNIAGDPEQMLGSMLTRGPACEAIASLERDILIPNTGLKTQLQFSRVSMSSGTGVTLGGTTQVMPRTPTLTVSGDTSILLEIGMDEAQTYFRSSVDDMRAPIKYQWSASGATFSAPTSSATYVTWSVIPPSGSQRTVTLTATDADNKTLTTSRTVSFLKAPSKLDL